MSTRFARSIRLVLCAFLVAASGSARADWLATGQFNYTDRTYDLTNYTGTVVRPVREADVQVYDTTSLAVLVSGATDSAGNFSLNVPDAATRNVAVRVLSSNVQVPSLNFAVVDDKNADAIYSYHDATTDRAGHLSTDAVNFGTMTMPASIGAVATTDWSSQVFNVYDMGVLLADWIANADGARPAIFYTILWNPTNGRTGSFYTPGTNRLSLSDDDAYDDPNILHEIGHYIEDEYGWSRNTGGTHFINDNDQDPRLAFSEGFATFVSAATLNYGGRPRPDIYCDFDGFGTSGGFAYTFEAPYSGGATREEVTTAALFDLIDGAATQDATPGTDDDPIQDQQANIWSVIEQMRVIKPAATSLEDFWDIWFSLGFGNLAPLTTVFSAHHVDFLADAQEPNDTPAQATTLTVNAAYQSNTFYRTGTVSAGDEDWFKFTATAGTYYAMEVNGTANTIFGRPDPEMYLFDGNLSAVLAYNDDPFDVTLNTAGSSTAQDMSETVPSILWQAPASGTYYIYVRHSSQERGLLGRYGSYQVRVRSLAVPTPTLTTVSEQRMLQGQSYQVLVQGTNFSRGATVTTSSANVAVGVINWLAPSALLVTLTPSAAVTDGFYNLTVTNPTGAGASLTNAFEVSAGAQPPIRITEVELGSDAVELKNLGTVTATLTGWTVRSFLPSGVAQNYTFPAFTLAPGATVVVRESTGTNTATDVYNATAFNYPWNPDQLGDLSLLDDAGRNVDFLRWVTSPVSEHAAVQGTGGAWMAPQFQAPSSSYTIARAETTALYRTQFGLSKALSTMATGAATRDNNVDPYEDNDLAARAPIFPANVSLTGLKISPRPAGAPDSDWFGFLVKPGDAVKFDALFTHASGNLDLELYAPGVSNTPLLTSNGAVNNESITLTSALSTGIGGGIYRVRVFGVSAATNSYTLNASPAGNPIITLTSGAISYLENDPATIIDAAATLTDADSPDFIGGSLTVDFAATGTADDRLEIRNQGTAAGQIGVSGNAVSFGGSAIGTFTGGASGSSPLVVSFTTAAATPLAAQALLRNITFRNVSENPSTTPRTLQFVANDGDGTTSSTVSRTVNVTAVNDAPSFTKGADQIVAEDAAPVTVGNWANNISAGLQETGQTVSFLVSNDNTGLFTTQPAIASNGTLTFTVAPNLSGAATVTVRIQDSGGTASGGVDTSAAQTFTITITPINDVPSFTKGADQTLNEDAGPRTIAGWATAISAGPQEGTQTVDFLVTNNNTSLFSTQPAVAANGTLTFTPAANANGSALVTVRIHDNGGTASGGIDTSAAQTFNITVIAVNDAPSFTKGADRTVAEDAGPQTIANWASAISPGPADESGQSVDFIVSNSNTALFAAQPALAANGTLTFTPAADANGSALVTMRLHDSGGTANGGIDTSAAQTFNITVTAVNDAPSFTKGADQALAEDAGPQIIANWASAITPGPADEAAQAVDFLVANDNDVLFSVPPAVAPNGTLTFTPAANANGAAIVTVRLHDNAGGADTSAIHIFNITVTAVNDPPSFTAGPNQAVLEDAGAQIVPGWASAVSPGPQDESTQTVDFLVSTTNDTLFAAVPAISANGTLTFTPAANANGAATVTVRAHDSAGGDDTSAPQTFLISVQAVNDPPTLDPLGPVTVAEDAPEQTIPLTGLSSGAANEAQSLIVTANSDTPGLIPTPAVVYTSPGATGSLRFTPTANASGTATVTVTVSDGGAENATFTRTFTVAVTAVNDPPSFTKGADQTIDEDAGPQSIPGWASAISRGPADEDSQTINFIVQTEKPALFATLPGILPDGTLAYTPIANANGSSTVTVKLRDDGGGDDTSAPQTFTITVKAVNDPPSFSKGVDIVAKQNAGLQTIPGWATALSAGPADETTQTLDFIVTSDNQPLFSVPPAISPNGTLTFTPATNANGAATVSVRLHDSGGTSPGEDTSAVQTFVISSTPVNDAPSFTAGRDQSIGQDRGPQTIAGWATNISPGPEDEAAQAVDFQVQVTDNAALFITPPSIAPDGTLTFTPAPAGTGTATISVQLHDNGGTADGGVDLSPPKTFRISVTTFDEELGTYNGLARPLSGAAPDNERAGLLKVTVVKKGAFTGSLKLARSTFALKGRFDKDGVAHFGTAAAPTLTLARKAPLSPLTLTLQLDVGQGTDKLTGGLSDNGQPFATLESDRALYSGKKVLVAPYRRVPAELLGKLTAVLAARSPLVQGRTADTFPQGDGYGLLTVSKSGTVKITGKLSDGTSISYGNALTKDNAWPLYLRLAKGAASVSGRAQLAVQAGLSEITAPGLSWCKPPGGPRYPAGWPEGLQLDLEGGKFTVARGQTVFSGLSAPVPLGNAHANLTAAGLGSAGLNKSLNVAASNAVAVITREADQLALTIKPTGVITGSFIHPTTTRRTGISGVILQKQQRAFGYFLTATESGHLSIAPLP